MFYFGYLRAELLRRCLADLGVSLPDARRGAAPGPSQGGDLGGDRSANPDAFSKCLPERMQRFRATITTPRETLQQIVDPPQTDLESRSYTIGGVQLGDATMGLVTSAQVTSGRFLKSLPPVSLRPPPAGGRKRCSPRSASPTAPPTSPHTSREGSSSASRSRVRSRSSRG